MKPRIIKTADRVKNSSRQEKLRALEIMVRDKVVFSAFRPSAMVRYVYQDIAEFSSSKELSAKDREKVIAAGVVYINEDKTIRMPLLSQQELDAFITSSLSDGKNVVDLRKLGDEKTKELYKLAKEAIDAIGVTL